MSGSLAAEREKVQRQIEELEQTLGNSYNEIELISSDTSSDDGSDDDDSDSQELGQPPADLCLKREKVQREIMELEAALGDAGSLVLSDEEDDEGSASEGPPADLCFKREKVQREIMELEAALGAAGSLVLSDDDDGDDEGGSSAESDSELDLSQTPETCLHMNLVYQQVLQEKLEELERLLQDNRLQQKESVSQLSGDTESRQRDRGEPTSYQQPYKMYLGRFLKPYFKCKLTGLGPPANQESKEKASKTTMAMDDKRLKLRKWEGWQKRLLIHSVARDCLKRLLQPKLSKIDYLTQKLCRSDHVEKLILKQQICQLERDMEQIKTMNEDDLIGGRFDDHDWPKISNIDFEGTLEAEDIQSFWQNFLHPSLNKSSWSQEEISRLAEVTGRHGERDWQAIAEELGTGRTPFMCLQTYQRYLSKTFKRSAWTPEEDSVLRDLVHDMRIGNFIPYTSMSYFMEGRQPTQLMYRWTQVLDPSLHKGFWSKEEDELLLKAVARHGERNWWKIRLEVPGRTDGSCRDRYLESLKAGTKKGAFDQQERELLANLVQKHGAGRWSRIAAEIPNRLDSQCFRAWRKITGHKQKKRVRPSKEEGGAARRRRRRQAVRSIRRRLDTLEEEELSVEEDEEEEEKIVYMDSDEEEKVTEGGQENSQVEQIREDVPEVQRKEVIEEEEEEEEAYVFPPMEAWLPLERPRGGGILRTQVVSLPSPAPLTGSTHHKTVTVRTTILDRFGQHVDTIIGPAPPILHKKYHHSILAMIKVPFGDIRNLMLWTAGCSRKRCAQRGMPPRAQRGSRNGFHGNKRQPTGMYDMPLQYDLMATITPWIGNLLLPVPLPFITRQVDAMRQRVQSIELPSTPVFLFFLQVLMVDVMGCKEMIEARKREISPQRPAHLIVKAPKVLNLKTVAGMLGQRQQTVPPMIQWMMLPQTPPPPSRPLHVSQQPLPVSQQPLIVSQRPLTVSQRPLPVSQRPLPVSQQPLTVSQQPLMLLGQQAAPLPASPMCLTLSPSALAPPPPFSTSTVVQVLLPPQAPPPQTPRHRGLPPNKTTPTLPATPPPPTPSTPGGQTVPSSPRQAVAPPSRQTGLVVSSSPQSPVPPSQSQPVSISVPPPGPSVAPPPCPSVPPSGPSVPPPGPSVAPPPGSSVVPPPLAYGPVGVVLSSPVAQDITSPPFVPAAWEQTRPPAWGQKTTSPRLSISPPPSSTHLPPASLPSASPPVSALSTTVPPPSTSNLPGLSSQSAPCPLPPPAEKSRGRKRGRKRGRSDGQQEGDGDSGSQQSVVGSPECVCASQKGVCVRGEGVCVSQQGKRFRKPTLKAKALMEAAKAEVEAKRKKASPSPRRKRASHQSPSLIKPIGQMSLPPNVLLAPGQDIWIMTANGLVPLVGHLPSGVQMVPRANTNLPAQPMNIFMHQIVPPPQRICTSTIPANVSYPAQARNVYFHQLGPPPPRLSTIQVAPPTSFSTLPISPLLPRKTGVQTLNPPILSVSTIQPQPQSVPPPTTFLQPLPPQMKPPAGPPPGSSPRVKVEPSAPPSLRLEAVQFDWCLMFSEPLREVCGWLSGRGGVAVLGLEVALPYMPPFISSLSTLSALLKAKRSLTAKALQLLPPDVKPRSAFNPFYSPTHNPTPVINPAHTPSPSRDHDYIQITPEPCPNTQPCPSNPAKDRLTTQPAPSSIPETSEADRVAAIRHLVAERLADNPAYQLLKARFLSCFTLPALLATIQPPTSLPQPPPANEEEVEDEEERVLQRIREKKSLLQEGQGPPATHYCGIVTRNATRHLGSPSLSHSRVLTDSPGPDYMTKPDQTRLHDSPGPDYMTGPGPDCMTGPDQTT